jgi:2-isopropylmalate synthase
MNLKEKIEMAKQLEKMKVDIIEAGFAITSPGDFESVQTISSVVKDCTVASLSRAAEKDIDASWEALKKAADPRIHIVIATSPIHMKYKLMMEPDAVIEKSVASVKYAAKYCSNIEFSAEDATRSDLDFMARIFDAVIKAGATTVNIPDTVGYTTPEEHYEFFMKLRELCPRLDDVTISAHCHNDLGLGTANSLAAIRAGVNQQRNRRAGRKRFHGRGGHGASYEKGSFPGRDENRHDGTDARVQAADPDHRRKGTAQQGHRRRKCLLS